MAKVRARPETGTLYLDFSYRGVRCREQTTLPDTAENRRKVQALLNRIEKEIRQGNFDYAATFPASPRAARFESLNGAAVDPGSRRPSTATDQNKTPLFGEFSVTWRAEMAPQWRRLHRGSVDAIFDAHLLPAFGDRPLSTITKADVLAARARMAALPGRTGETLSPASINKVIGILRQCMTEASERFGLPDVLKGVKRLKARRPDVQPFSLEEVERIRATIRPDFRDYVTVRFFTGMRTGEINGLRWKYVDFAKGLILVRETFSAGEAEENAKSETSLRDIPMLPAVRAALERRLAERSPDSEYVFCTREGNPVDAHNFANRVWYPLLRYLELDKRRPYQTRHTTATLMLASGENPEWIARLMGHANTQMLFTVYSRFVPNLTRQDGLAITGLLNSREQKKANAADPISPDQLAAMSADQLRSALTQLLATPTP
ncbi:MAG: site-specific integrase [Propionivibrio sp.]|nr:site-specific integrase [Propionivibrio sp.]